MKKIPNEKWLIKFESFNTAIAGSDRTPFGECE